MNVRAIRGAITILEDTPEEISSKTTELLSEIIEKNNLNLEDICYTEFTVTNDIKSATPAKFARLNLKFDKVPLMCVKEFEFDGSLPMCIRVLVVFNTDKTQNDVKHIYLHNAKKLRPDIN